MNTRQGKRAELIATINLNASNIEAAMLNLTAKKDRKLRERIQHDLEGLCVTVARIQNGLYDE